MFFSSVLFAKNTTIVCTRTSASNTMTGEIFNTSSWSDKTWYIDTNNKIVRANNGIKWHSEFTESEIRWGLCFGEEDGGKPIKNSCPRSADGKILYIHKGYQNSLNRKTLSYTECINDNAWICLQRHKGYCQIAKENKL